MLKYILALLITSFSAVSVAQQPWTKKAGEAYVQAGFSYLGYKNIYLTPTSHKVSPRVVRQFIWSGYSEIGITDRLMLTLNVPFQYINNGDPDTSGVYVPAKGWMTGMGNIYSGLTVKLVEKGAFTLSTSLGVNYKSARRVDPLSLQTGYQAWGIQPMVMAGWGFEKSYAAVGVGANIRTHNYTDQLLVKAQWGTRFGKNKHLWFILGTNTCIPLSWNTQAENDAVDGLVKHGYTYMNQVGYLGIDIKLGYQFGSKEDPLWSVWASLGGGPGWQVAQAPVWVLSFGRELRKKKND